MKVNYYQRRGGKKVKLICSYCGKEFERYLYDIKKRNAKYCSIKCSIESRKIKMPPREVLYDRYWKDEISVNQLAKEYSVSKFLIYKWMKKMLIPTRTISKGVSIAQTGIKHSEEWNEAISRGQRKMKPETRKKKILATIYCNRNYGSRSKGGIRPDLGIYLRSSWEANLCRYYNFFNIKWIYEPETFFFNESSLIKKKLKRGSVCYTPDFYLPDTDSLVEIKGFFRLSDMTKLKRFRKYYPMLFNKLKFIIYDKYSRSKANGEIMAFLIDVLGIDFRDIESYKEMEKFGSMIPEWE
jgi:predicted DNA-binding protein YlxM (UPF0122 family)